jgi:predicted DNA-binding transcriptional regulator AlpA
MTSRLQHEGFLRLKEIISPFGPVPVKKSTWWLWVKAGKAPAPIKLGCRITVWRTADIEAFLLTLDEGAQA